MKRFPLFLILAVCLSITACENGSDGSGQDSDPSKISVNEAIQVATEGIAMLSESDAGTIDRRINSNSVKICSTNTGKLFYVINFANNNGFAVVRATRGGDSQLLAVAESGNYTPGVSTGNSGFDAYAELLTNYLIAAESAPAVVATTAATRSGWESAGPYLAVKWGQDAPYNTYCLAQLEGVDFQPCPTGSIATAIAQIMSFHAYPSEMAVTFINDSESGYTYNGIDSEITLDWSAIKQLSSGSTNAASKPLAVLIREIGQLVGMKYAIEGSAAASGNVPTALAALGYTSGELNNYEWQPVREELDNGRPLFMGGAEDDFVPGASWVVDGYKTRETQAGCNYLHINWGSNGNGNGYYLADIFNASSKAEGAKYNYKSYIVTGIAAPSAN